MAGLGLSRRTNQATRIAGACPHSETAMRCGVRQRPRFSVRLTLRTLRMRLSGSTRRTSATRLNAAVGVASPTAHREPGRGHTRRSIRRRFRARQRLRRNGPHSRPSIRSFANKDANYPAAGFGAVLLTGCARPLIVRPYWMLLDAWRAAWRSSRGSNETMEMRPHGAIRASSVVAGRRPRDLAAASQVTRPAVVDHRFRLSTVQMLPVCSLRSNTSRRAATPSSTPPTKGSIWWRTLSKCVT